MPEDRPSKPFRKIDDATYGVPPESRSKRGLVRALRWVQLDADRNLVAAALLVATFVAIVLVGAFGPVSVREFLTRGVSPGTVLIELLKTIVSVVVIVLSINQLVLSPGLGPVGDQRERYDQSIELRREVEDYTGIEVSPSSPAAFLATLLERIVDQAERIDELFAGDPADAGTDRAADADEFAGSVVAEAMAVVGLLRASRFGEFEVVSAALRFAISEKVRTLQAISAARGDSLSEAQSEALDEMGELLELFTVAREYLKTVYIREEYIGLSESLLYSGLPAIVVTFCASQIYYPGVFPGDVFGIERRLLFVSGAVAVSLAPFVVLVSYVFRLAPMSRSTLFVGPFDARESGTDRDERHGRGR